MVAAGTMSVDDESRQRARELSARGVARAMAQAYGEALALFDEALQSDPTSAEALNNRGFIREMMNDFAGAKADYDAALLHDPRLASALANRGGIRLAELDIDGAMSDLDAAVTIEPNHGPARVLRAHGLYHRRDVAACEVEFRAAFSLDAAYAARAVVELIAKAIQQDPRLILKGCDQHIRNSPHDFHSFARRGLALMLLGQNAAADADFERYRQANPGGVWMLMRTIEEVKGRLDAALTFANPS
jgi:tetratricopeptide (TPR) repeat protein